MRGNRSVRVAMVLCVLAGAAAACSTDDPARSDGAAVRTRTPVAGSRATAPPVSAESLGLDLSSQTACDPIGGTATCFLPYPNDHFTVRDDDTDTGRHLVFDRDHMPANAAGVRVDTAAFTSSDDFSPGSPLLIDLPGLDAKRSRLPGLTDLDASLAADAPIVLWDATARRRQPYWAELDALAEDGTPTLIVHPATNFPEAHRIVVGLRNLVDATGAPLARTPAFDAYRTGQRTTDTTFEARRPSMEQVFADLGDAGVARNGLQLAWDFTIGSARSIAGRLLAMRDDAFAQLGNGAPSFTVESVVEHPDGDARIFRQVDGTFSTPLYMTGTGEPGASLVLDADGAPVRQAGTFTAPFRCMIPPSATHDSASGPAVPARMSLYGHGLLGDLGEVGSDMVLDMGSRNNIVYCASNLAGMAAEDVGNAIGALGDLSRFSHPSGSHPAGCAGVPVPRAPHDVRAGLLGERGLPGRWIVGAEDRRAVLRRQQPGRHPRRPDRGDLHRDPAGGAR